MVFSHPGTSSSSSKSFWVFRSYVRHFRGAILGLLRPSLPWCFPIRGPAAAAKASQQQEEKVAKIHSSRKGKRPKSSFSMGLRSYHFRVQFWGVSVLHCHGVFPSGDQQQQQKPLQQREEKVAKTQSSSKRKKQPKSSFSIAFRSCGRHFRDAILVLLRPSLPWFSHPGTSSSSKSLCSSRRKR